MMIRSNGMRLCLGGCVTVVALACSERGQTVSSERLTLGATTSIEDSGLLQVLADSFRAAQPEYELVPLAAGTGEVLEMGRRGDVDVVLTHDLPAESAFVAAGAGVDRRDVMSNDFIIAGPPSDPARVRGMHQGARALAQIARARALFVSRGDDSGTHRRERLLWRMAPFAPDVERDGAWYLEAGLGMGDALRLAGERDAYILTDRGTWLTLRASVPLEALVQGDSLLLNRYGVTRVSRARNAKGAAAFSDWITSARGQSVIERFGLAQYGESLFHSVTGARHAGGTTTRR
jgi:tungstate transport system substrate-binding protein